MVFEAIDIHKARSSFAEYEKLGYYRHLNHSSRWRLRKAIEQGIASAINLGTPRLESFGRCVVLRAAQWALDGRSKQTSIEEFRGLLTITATAMLEGARELRDAVTEGACRRPRIEIIRRSAAGLEGDERVRGRQAPALILTSPPYPGVHVLYHRWQVDGRKEAPLPFMIANKFDGAGLSHYTMGDRKRRKLATYFENIRSVMSSVAALADRNTVIVQMIAFSQRSWQLPRYLATMKEVGLQEVFLPVLKGQRDGRLWRPVPGQRWYIDRRGLTSASQEVVLIHRKAESF